MSHNYYCTTNLFKSDSKRTRAFTAGKLYKGRTIPHDGFTEVRMTDDQKHKHHITDLPGGWLQYFEKQVPS